MKRTYSEMVVEGANRLERIDERLVYWGEARRKALGLLRENMGLGWCCAKIPDALIAPLAKDIMKEIQSRYPEKNFDN